MSKKAKIWVALLCGIAAIVCTSCENLFSIEYRIVGSWQVSHTYLNDVEIDSTEYLGYAPQTYYYIYADHVMSVMARYGGEYRESSFAMWVADQKNKTVNFQYTFFGKEYDFTAKILKLTKSELLIEFTDEEGNRWKLQMFSRSRY
jgi:hypothetical protein